MHEILMKFFLYTKEFPPYKNGFASIFDEIDDAPTFTFIMHDYLNFEQFCILFLFILIPIVFIVIATTAAINGKKWQHFRRELANISTLFVPWQLRIKEIESHFGSVVASYFTFLRWLFWVNIVLAFTLSSFVILPEVRISLRLTQHIKWMKKESASSDKQEAIAILHNEKKSFVLFNFNSFLRHSTPAKEIIERPCCPMKLRMQLGSQHSWISKAT